ncbi:MAG: energy transducer TonB [Polyangiales bacterium]
MNPRSPSFFLSSIVVHGAFFSALAAAPTEVEPSPVSRTIEFTTITEEGGGRLGNDETIGDAAKVPETPPERLFQKVQPKPKRSRPVAAVAPESSGPSKPIETAAQSEGTADDGSDATGVATVKGSAGSDPSATRSGVGSGAEGVDRRSALRAWLSEVQREVNKIASRNYPRSALRMRLEGRLRLGVTIGPDGKILGVRVLSSSGHTVLDESATASVTALDIPPPPQALGWRAREISLPVRYALD